MRWQLAPRCARQQVSLAGLEEVRRGEAQGVEAQLQDGALGVEAGADQRRGGRRVHASSSRWRCHPARADGFMTSASTLSSRRRPAAMARR